MMMCYINPRTLLSFYFTRLVTGHENESALNLLCVEYTQTSVASYIRLFEPLVIKSLKQYTVTSQVVLQQQVLDLLAQLVQLRVNYCLLDSDQVCTGMLLDAKFKTQYILILHSTPDDSYIPLNIIFSVHSYS